VPNSETVDDRPENPQLFISYASCDLPRAAALHARLKVEGFRVWFDKARLTPGCDWHKEIEAGCEAAHVILPLLTPAWSKSEWTRYETYASSSIIPVLVEGKAEEVMPPPLRRWNAHALDPLGADEDAWAVLITSINTKLSEPIPARAPRVLDLPHPANPFFTGRDHELIRIHEELHTAPVAALTQGRVRALAAMGGVGKTTLANEYARRFWRLYPQILWVDAREGLENGFALLFAKLFPDRLDQGMKQHQKAKAVLEAISDRAERLLVIDNVEDAESVRPWLPCDLRTGCRVLITSRFSDWPTAEGIRVISLYALEPASARRFLLARTKRIGESAEQTACDDLAKELGYLPLALEQAAAYIAAPGSGTTFSDYLRLYRESAAEMLTRGVLGSTHYPNSVAVTWQTTIAKLSPESRAILRLCAWYADTPIPRKLIMEGADDIIVSAQDFGPVEPLAGAVTAELRLRDAVTGLARYSMILDANDETFRIHGLVQTVERMQAEVAGTIDTIARAALNRLFKTFPDEVFSAPDTWPLARQLLPHVIALEKHCSTAATTTEFANLIEASGRFLHGSGEMAAAEVLLRRALALHKVVSGPDSYEAAGCEHNLAHCINRVDPASAKTLLQHALQVYERELGAAHRNTLTCRSDLAVMLMHLGDFTEGAKQSRIIVRDSEASLGADDEVTRRATNNLAFCMMELGDTTGALPLFKSVLAYRERVLGTAHPTTIISTNNLANCMRRCHDREGATLLYQRALVDGERVLGQTHPDVFVSRNGLAQCMKEAGNAEEALKLYRLNYTDCERSLGMAHPYTLRSVANLASCMQTLGDAAGALPLLRRASETSDHVFGAEHPETFRMLNKLASCMRSLGDTEGALPLLRRASQGSERVLGAEHPDARLIMKNLADCVEALNKAAGNSPPLPRGES